MPTQVVAPYRPHKDLEAAPLLEGDCALTSAPLQDHAYHEISDEETNNSPHLDLGTFSHAAYYLSLRARNQMQKNILLLSKRK